MNARRKTPFVRPFVVAAALSALVTGSALAQSRLRAQESVLAPDQESRLVSALQELSEQDLKAAYLGCSRDALRGELDWNEIAACSVVYEKLLTREFGGDFFALLAWSRSRSNEPAGIALGRSSSGLGAKRN